MAKKTSFFAIKRSFEFDLIYKNGRKIRASSWLTIITMAAVQEKVDPKGEASKQMKSSDGRESEPVSASFYGITASRKVGSAVVRNKLKRWIRNCAKADVWPARLKNKKSVFIFRPQPAGFYKELKFEDFMKTLKSLDQR